MTLRDVQESAAEYGLTISVKGAMYIIKKNGKQIGSIAKSKGLAKLTDFLQTLLS